MLSVKPFGTNACKKLKDKFSPENPVKLCFWGINGTLAMGFCQQVKGQVYGAIFKPQIKPLPYAHGYINFGVKQKEMFVKSFKKAFGVEPVFDND
jgi:hypothetical protein